MIEPNCYAPLEAGKIEAYAQASKARVGKEVICRSWARRAVAPGAGPGSVKLFQKAEAEKWWRNIKTANIKDRSAGHENFGITCFENSSTERSASGSVMSPNASHGAK